MPVIATTFRAEVQQFIESLQNHICAEVERVDGSATFHEDAWLRPEGGGGKTRIIQNGTVFEKGGVAFSAVHGKLPAKMAQKMHTEPSDFFATGVSVVLHPESPMIPTVHCNYRYFEQYDHLGNVQTAWFGGGADLTPYYPTLADVQHFHRIHKAACDNHDLSFYPRFKKQCDEYFYLPHRKETRGVGGIFFDYLKDEPEKTFAFVKDCGLAFTDAYLPIAERRKHDAYSEREKKFQLLRRGRYVEFNLVYDRGTLFGLETNGRTESILMSLPALVSWQYNYQPEPDSQEANLWNYLTPRDWLSM
jgi:coproporphyrinogen III oxidase